MSSIQPNNTHQNKSKNSPKLSRVAGVAGWPIHHSLSPLLHNFWLRQSNMSGSYVHFAVRPDEAVRAFKGLKHTNISGMNVTLPLKSHAFEAADVRTKDAQRVGACNCLYVRGNTLYGHNTDLAGFAQPLLSRLSLEQIASKPAMLIGAGGASRAVIAALQSLKVPHIFLTNRTDERAYLLADELQIDNLSVVPWGLRINALAAAGLIINSSAAGMIGKPALDLSLEGASKEALVYDLIYTPLETPLMAEAKAKGLGVIGGLDMLIEQARPSFRLFFGEEPNPKAKAKDLLIKALDPNLNLGSGSSS